MMHPEQLIERIRPLCMVQGVDVVKRGHIRIQTAFLYPDGSSVDVFVRDERREPLLPPSMLTDFGHTLDYLLTHGVASSKRRATQIADAIEVFGVSLNEGALEKPFRDSTLVEGIVLLGQACARVADLVFTRHAQLQAPFAESVEDFLRDAGLDYESNARLPGPFGEDVSVDFLVRGRTSTSAVLTLGARTPGGPAHTQANEVLRRAHDLAIARRRERRVALIDDSVHVLDIYRRADLDGISRYAEILSFSDRDSLRDQLAA